MNAQEGRKPLVLVAAMAQNRVIGKDNAIPWRLPEDMKHFRRVTLKHAVIMGRGTYDSMGKPLPDRVNIVVSRNPQLAIEGAHVVSSLEAALTLARAHDDEPRVIGGGQLYAEALPLATRIYLTVLDDAYEGDTYFPELDASDWRTSEERRGEAGSATYLTLERV
jgi:dihydrofolate reductase